MRNKKAPESVGGKEQERRLPSASMAHFPAPGKAALTLRSLSGMLGVPKLHEA